MATATTTTTSRRPGPGRSIGAVLLGALGLALAAAAPAAGPAGAVEQLDIVVPAKAGSGWDQAARAIAVAMQRAGVAPTLAVENVPGAGGTAGLAEFVDRREGDGGALMVAGLGLVGAALANQSAASLKDATPIARLAGEYLVVAVPAASAVTSLRELAEAVAADPAAVAWGGGPVGGPGHVLAGLIADAVGADPSRLAYVPFPNGPEALAAVLAGRVAAGVGGLGEWREPIANGEIRALAVSAPERLPGRDLRTLAEQGVDVALVDWLGVVAPPGLGEDGHRRLLEAVDTMVKDEAWRRSVEERGWVDLYLAGDPFALFLAVEEQRVAGVLRRLGLTQ